MGTGRSRWLPVRAPRQQNGDSEDVPGHSAPPGMAAQRTINVASVASPGMRLIKNAALLSFVLLQVSLMYVLGGSTILILSVKI